VALDTSGEFLSPCRVVEAHHGSQEFFFAFTFFGKFCFNDVP
jgi:hypothetical protein